MINDAIDKQFEQAESKDLFRSIPNTEGSNNIQFDTENILRKQTEIVTLIHKNIKEVEARKCMLYWSLKQMFI